MDRLDARAGPRGPRGSAGARAVCLPWGRLRGRLRGREETRVVFPALAEALAGQPVGIRAYYRLPQTASLAGGDVPGERTLTKARTADRSRRLVILQSHSTWRLSARSTRGSPQFFVFLLFFFAGAASRSWFPPSDMYAMSMCSFALVPCKRCRWLVRGAGFKRVVFFLSFFPPACLPISSFPRPCQSLRASLPSLPLTTRAPGGVEVLANGFAWRDPVPRRPGLPAARLPPAGCRLPQHKGKGQRHEKHAAGRFSSRSAPQRSAGWSETRGGGTVFWNGDARRQGRTAPSHFRLRFPRRAVPCRALRTASPRPAFR